MNYMWIMKNCDTQEKCIAYLEDIRWGGKPRCPYCKSSNCKRNLVDKRIHCNRCNRNFSVLVGTIFEDTKLPLVKWFMAILLINGARKGISSYQLARQIGTRQKTAWYMMLRIRAGMHRGLLLWYIARGQQRAIKCYHNTRLKNPDRKRKRWLRSVKDIAESIKSDRKPSSDQHPFTVNSKEASVGVQNHIRRALLGQFHHWTAYYSRSYIIECRYKFLERFNPSSLHRLLSNCLSVLPNSA